MVKARHQDTKNNIVEYMLFATAVLLVCGVAFGILLWYNANVFDSTGCERIESYIVGPYEYNEHSGMIELHTIDDVHYTIKSNKIILSYGGVIIKLPRTLVDKDDAKVYTHLTKIGINLQHRKTEDGSTQYKMTYFGEPVRCTVMGEK